jgi:hypothetical protein
MPWRCEFKEELNVYYYSVDMILVQTHHAFACTACFGQLRPSSDIQSFYNPPALASVYTLGVLCTGMLFMQCPYVIKCIKY